MGTCMGCTALMLAIQLGISLTAVVMTAWRFSASKA